MLELPEGGLDAGRLYTQQDEMEEIIPTKYSRRARHRSIDHEAIRDDNGSLPSVVAQRRQVVGERNLRTKIEGVSLPANSYRKHI